MSSYQNQRALSYVPSLNALLKAAKLSLPAYGCGTVIFSSATWQFLLIGGIAGVSGGGIESFGFCLMISVGTLAVSIAWFLLWTGLYSVVLKLLWAKPPRWLALPTQSTLANRDFPILTLSTLPVAVLFLLHIALNASLRHTLQSPPPLRLGYDAFLLKFFWLWFVSATSLYHRWPQTGRKHPVRHNLKQSRKAV